MADKARLLHSLQCLDLTSRERAYTHVRADTRNKGRPDCNGVAPVLRGSSPEVRRRKLAETCVGPAL